MPATLYDNTFDLTGGGGDATVRVQVEDINPHGTLQYTWRYTVTNVSVGSNDVQDYINSDSLTSFWTFADGHDTIVNLTGPTAWQTQTPEYFDDTRIYASLYAGAFPDPGYLPWGESATFTFTTPPREIVPQDATFGDDTFGEANGVVVGPGAAGLATVVTVAKLNDVVEGGTNGKFRFTRTGDTSSSLTVNFSVDGTATSGSDYTTLSGTVTFPANSATADVEVVASSDNEFESAETVQIAVTEPLPGMDWYTPGGNQPAVVTITDDPPRVEMSVSWDSNSQSPEIGSVTLSRFGGDINQPLTVWFEPTGTVVFDGESLTVMVAATAVIPVGDSQVTIPLLADPADGGPSALQMPGATPTGTRADQSQQIQQLRDQFNGSVDNDKRVGQELIALLTKLPVGGPLTYSEHKVLRPLANGSFEELIADGPTYTALLAVVNSRYGRIDWRTLPQLQGVNVIQQAAGVTGYAAVLAGAGWPQTEAKLQLLIDDLGSEDFATRNAAEQSIRDLATTALTRSDLVRIALIHDRMLKTAATDENAEVRNRAGNIVDYIRGLNAMRTYEGAKIRAAAAVAGAWVYSTLP
ncbi:MAG: Calx-beta domain-containing protein [Gemmataceae bacterium]